MTRFPRALFLAILTLALTLPVSAARRRAVQPPGPACSFALTTTYAAPVPADGMQRGVVSVTGTPSSCTSWEAFSSVDWITIEKAPGQALLTVAPNPTQQPRSAAVRIAGLRHEVNQDAAAQPPLAPTNLLANAGFDLDLQSWGWPAHLPNGTGSAAWTSLDSNGAIASGSMRLRNTQTGHSFQHQQCVKTTGRRFTFGGDVQVAVPSVGAGVIALFQYPNDSCAEPFQVQTLRDIRPPTAGVWQPASFSIQLSSSTRSVLFLVASAAINDTPFDVWFDDLFLEPQP